MLGTLAATSLATATTWTVSGASAGGTSQSVTSLNAGSIGINVNASGFTSGTVLDPSGVRSALWGSVGSSLAIDDFAFFGFTDSGGSGATYFGFGWLFDRNDPESLSFSSTTSGTEGVLTNITGATSAGVSGFTPTVSGPPAPENDFRYFLFANVVAPSTITITGTLANSAVKWLDWSGSSWTTLPGASGAGTGSGGGFELENAVLPTAVPAGGVAALAGGLAAGLLRRRRHRQSR